MYTGDYAADYGSDFALIKHQRRRNVTKCVCVCVWGGTSLYSGSESGGGHKHIFAPHSEKWGAHAPLAPPPGSYASEHGWTLTEVN